MDENATSWLQNTSKDSQSRVTVEKYQWVGFGYDSFMWFFFKKNSCINIVVYGERKTIYSPIVQNRKIEIPLGVLQVSCEMHISIKKIYIAFGELMKRLIYFLSSAYCKEKYDLESLFL